MKKIYSAFLPLTLLLSSCSKDFLKDYEERLEGGTWEIYDVDRQGIGGGSENLPFTEGSFRFEEGGRLVYNDPFGNTYNGSWDLRRQQVLEDCDYDDNGGELCNYRTVKSLQLTAVHFNTRDIRADHFDEIRFTGTHRFNAYIKSGWRTYVLRFRR